MPDDTTGATDPDIVMGDVQSVRPERESRWGCLIAPLFVLVPFILVCRILSPSDWVDLTIGRFPEKTQNWCVLAEDADGSVAALPWYYSKVVPFADSPIGDGKLFGGRYVADDNGNVEDSVQWHDAQRYSVLIQLTDGSWQLYRLEPSEISRPSIGRFLMGGGYATIWLPKETRAEVPSADFLKRLGLSK